MEKYLIRQKVDEDRHFQLRLSPDARYLVTAKKLPEYREYNNAILTLWELGEEITKVAEVNGDLRNLHDVVFHPDGQHLVISGWRLIKVRDIPSLEVSKRINFSDDVQSLCFSPDGKWLIATTSYSDIHLIDWETGKIVSTFEDTGEYHMGVSISPNNIIAAVAVTSGFSGVDVCQLQDGELLPVQRFIEDNGSYIESEQQAFRGTFSPCGKFYAVSHVQVLVYSYPEGQIVYRFEIRDENNPNHYLNWSNVLFSDDGRYLFCGASNGFIYIWDLKSGSLHRKFKAHEEKEPERERGYISEQGVFDLSYNGEKNFLASCGEDGCTRIWDLNTIL